MWGARFLESSFDVVLAYARRRSHFPPRSRNTSETWGTRTRKELLRLEKAMCSRFCNSVKIRSYEDQALRL
jgi:hypothetical protein